MRNLIAPGIVCILFSAYWAVAYPKQLMDTLLFRGGYKPWIPIAVWAYIIFAAYTFMFLTLKLI